MAYRRPLDGPGFQSGRWIGFAAICCLYANGCATLPYRFSQSPHPQSDSKSQVVVEYGRPQKTLDDIAWFMGIWSRLLPLNSRVNSHNLSAENQEKLIAYLESNDLTDVLVRVNQYDPKGEWRRLRENRRISAGWRYTAGTLSLVPYSLLPGRVFGGDQYNPYTNTLYLNSDVSAIALHEAAYAKDIHLRSLPGCYAVINGVPLLSMWRHTVGVNDVLGYARTKDDWALERETYRVVYPQMGVQSVAFAGTVVPFWDGVLITVAGAAAGHATGQIALSRRDRARNDFMDDFEYEDLPESEPLMAVQANESKTDSIIELIDHTLEVPDHEPPPPRELR